MLYEEWKSRYKNLKNFNTVLQRCPRFWPLAPPRGMNPGVYSLGISEDPPRYLSSKFDASVRSDCWDISIWKTLTQCDGNGNANANDRGDYNSSPCTSYRRAKKAALDELPTAIRSFAENSKQNHRNLPIFRLTLCFFRAGKQRSRNKATNLETGFPKILTKNMLSSHLKNCFCCHDKHKLLNSNRFKFAFCA